MQWGPRGVAEEEGFEPSVQLPIRHISNVLVSATNRLAEGEGFEPPKLSLNGFQDRRFKPLTHPSKGGEE